MITDLSISEPPSPTGIRGGESTLLCCGFGKQQQPHLLGICFEASSMPILDSFGRMAIDQRCIGSPERFKTEPLGRYARPRSSVSMAGKKPTPSSRNMAAILRNELGEADDSEKIHGVSLKERGHIWIPDLHKGHEGHSSDSASSHSER